MNVDSESSSSKKTGGEGSKRTNYFRGSQKRGTFNRHKYPGHPRANNSPSHYNEELETNNNTNYNSAAEDVTDKFSALHVPSSNNFRGPNKQTFIRTQYNLPRQTDHRNLSKDHNRSFNHIPCTAEQDSAESTSTSNVPKPSQRGQIVGGRYIRKQPSHSNSSKGYRDSQPENSYEYERNYNMRYQSNSSYKYKNSNSYNETQEHPRKGETYNRHVNDSSSESGAQHNASYQPREFKKKYTDSHNSSYKYNNYSSSSEEATNYKTNKFFKQRTSQQKPKRTISEDDKATQRGEFYFSFIFSIKF